MAAFDNFMNSEGRYGLGGKVPQPPSAFNEFFAPRDVLAEDPRSAYFSFQDRFKQGASPRQRDYFGGQFQDVHNEFLGRIGEQLRQNPSQRAPTFTSFMRSFPFQQRFAALPPSMRGAAMSRFAPQTRFFF